MLRFFRLLLLTTAFLTGSVFAAEQPYSQSAFEQLQRQGKPVLLVLHADWCSTCAVQEAVVDDLLRTPQLAAITALRVDFDNQKAVVKALKVRYQSTLIVFKGGKEVGRSTGDTSKEGIVALLQKAI